MRLERDIPDIGLKTLPRKPSWVISARTETLEDVVFRSGVALAVLHLVVFRSEVSQPLLQTAWPCAPRRPAWRWRGVPSGPWFCATKCICCAPAICPVRQAAARPMTPEGLQRALPGLTRA
jgi:hypothetical protein